jgi:membrane protease YdiL (CAAX protease family)
MATDLTHPALESGSRIRLTKLVYAALFLIATSALFFFLTTGYSLHLVRTKRFPLAFTLQEYLAPAQSLFFFVQLLAILLFFYPLRLMFDYRTVRHPNRFVVRNIFLGLFAGLTALLATLPSFIGNHGQPGIVMFLVDHLSIRTAIGLVLLLVFLLPFAEAIFFYGILLTQLLESISVVSALFVSTLLFMLSGPAFDSWPAFNFLGGATLGLATGIVFCRTKSVLACAVANASFTVGAIILQLWRLP